MACCGEWELQPFLSCFIIVQVSDWMGYLSFCFFVAEVVSCVFTGRTELRARQPLGPDVCVPERLAQVCRHCCRWFEHLLWVGLLQV